MSCREAPREAGPLGHRVEADTDVAAQYNAWAYPKPLSDLSVAVSKDGYFDFSDPALYRRKLWPKGKRCFQATALRSADWA